MTVTTTLHLNFRDQAKEALEFYQSIFGGDILLVPYGDGDYGQTPGQSEQIVWGQVLAPNGFHIMAYDVQDSFAYDPGENAFYVSLRCTETDEVTRFGQGLADSEGATVHVPFGPSAFSPLYGKVTDRFGVTWVIDVVVPWSA